MAAHDGFSQGTKVCWNWGNGWGKGTVKMVYTSDVTRTIKGTEVKRTATNENPAYLIEQQDGDQVLKSHSEISKHG